MADINEELGRRTLKEFTAEFGHNKVTFVKCDVTKVSICSENLLYFLSSLLFLKDEDWTAALSSTLSFFSSSQLDILVRVLQSQS